MLLFWVKLILQVHILLMVYAIFYGYFLSRNLYYIYSKSTNHNFYINKWIVITLFFLIPIWFINGFDFYFATQIFLYATIPYIYENKTRRLPLLILAPLTHFSFFFVIGVFFIYYFSQKLPQINLFKLFLLFCTDVSWAFKIQNIDKHRI